MLYSLTAVNPKAINITASAGTYTIAHAHRDVNNTFTCIFSSASTSTKGLAFTAKNDKLYDMCSHLEYTLFSRGIGCVQYCFCVCTYSVKFPLMANPTICD